MALFRLKKGMANQIGIGHWKDLVNASCDKSRNQQQTHVFQLLCCLSQPLDHLKHNPTGNFETISLILASYILFDEITEQKNGEDTSDAWMSNLDVAWKTFSRIRMPCNYSECTKMQKNHGWYHSNSVPGRYRVDSPNNLDELKELIQAQLQKISQVQTYTERTQSNVPTKHGMESMPTGMISARLHNEHQQRITNAFVKFDTFPFRLHTCFYCLRNVPNCILACGHSLCNSCMRTFAETEGLILTIRKCPLCGSLKRTVYYSMPSEVGLRVLVLQNSDAEGGLSQLEVLTKLQKCLEPLPIQRLFDLIVGVGYGGLIAMLLAQGHTVERCKDILKRVFEENPKINIFSGYNADRKMEEILKCHFQDGKPLACQYQEGGAKTAIIGSSGGRNFLIAGYCHPNQKLTGYPREISLKPWEAVAATLLAGKKNPRLAEWVIEEINAIWGKEKKKDLLISIGSNANCRSANQSWMHVAANDLMLFSENFNKKFHLESLSQETAQRVANNLLALCFYLQNNTFQIVLNCRPELGDLASFLWDHNKNFEFQLIQNHVDHMPQNMKFPLDWSRGILTPISIPIPDWRAIKVSLLSKDNWNSFEISGGVLEKPRLHEHPALQPLPLSITPKGTKHTFWKPGK